MCRDRKARGRRSQEDQYAFLFPRPFTDLELGGRVDDVSDACSCMDGL